MQALNWAFLLDEKTWKSLRGVKNALYPSSICNLLVPVTCLLQIILSIKPQVAVILWTDYRMQQDCRLGLESEMSTNMNFRFNQQ